MAGNLIKQLTQQGNDLREGVKHLPQKFDLPGPVTKRIVSMANLIKGLVKLR